MDDLDRAAILARRQHFIALALTGLSSGCRPSAPPDSLPEPAIEEPSDCLRELADLPDPAQVDPSARAELAQAYQARGEEALRSPCLTVAFEALRIAHELVPDQRGTIYFAGEFAYRVGDHRTAYAALSYFVAHANTFRMPRAGYERKARQLLRSIEDGLGWEERRPKPRPQPCLSPGRE